MVRDNEICQYAVKKLYVISFKPIAISTGERFASMGGQ